MSPDRIICTVVGSPFGPVPSKCLRTTVAGTRLRRSTSAVPWVARISKPSSESTLIGKIMCRLSRLAMLTKTRPLVGSEPNAAACAFANAVPKSESKPITSPVDFISGPRMVSTCLPSGVRNLLNGITASLTAIGWSGGSEPPSPCAGSTPAARRDAIDSPSITRAAALASGTAVALETNGTVREARGFASST